MSFAVPNDTSEAFSSRVVSCAARNRIPCERGVNKDDLSGCIVRFQASYQALQVQSLPLQFVIRICYGIFRGGFNEPVRLVQSIQCILRMQSRITAAESRAAEVSRGTLYGLIRCLKVLRLNFSLKSTPTTELRSYLPDCQ